MSTDYPASLDSYDTRVDNVDDVLASHMNDVQDAIVAIETELGTNPVQEGTWTPTVTQSGSVAVTVNYADYKIWGSVCHVEAKLSVTGAGTGGNDIVIGGFPAAIQPARTGSPARTPIGLATVLDASVQEYWGLLTSSAGGDWRIRDSNTQGVIGTSPNFALASGDIIWITASYMIS